MTGDRDEILETCARYGWHADLREWDLMAELFTEQVELDNTGMPGGGKRVVDRESMIAGWAEMFDTIDVTQHLMTNQLVRIDGDTARCDAQFFAQHIATVPVGEPALIVAGSYRFGLVRTEGGWRIDALRIAMSWTDGNAAVLGGGRPVEEDAATLARRFLTALSTGAVDDAIACLADDVVQDMPYSPPGYPKQLRGVETMRGLWTGLLKAVRSITYTIEEIRSFDDPRWAFAEFTAELVQPSGKTYSNHYFTFFHAEGGRITIYRELYDPLVFEAEVSDEDRAAMFATGQS